MLYVSTCEVFFENGDAPFGFLGTFGGLSEAVLQGLQPTSQPEHRLAVIDQLDILFRGARH